MNIFLHKSLPFSMGGVLLGMISFFGSMSSSSAAVINAQPGQGFMPVSSFSGTVRVPVSSSINSAQSQYAGFAIAPNSVGVDGVCQNNLSQWKTIDGYYGYEVMSGVLLVIYNTQITGDVVSSTGGSIAVNGNISSTGILSGSLPPKRNGVNCYSYLTGERVTTTETITQFSGSYGYYISSTASLTPETGFQPTTIAFRRAMGIGQAWNTNYISINPGDNLIIKEPPMTCSVSVPPVDFGEVASTAVGNKVVVESTLGVNCTNTSNNSIPITYSMTPKTQAGDQTSIPMISKAGGTVGDIRGFLGANASADAGCVAKTSSVRMDGSQTPLRTVPSNNSAPWTSPLVWVLCPKATAKPGVASAAATFELNW
ncbi:spore coat protein U domain-containing protein [Klebsiella pneumoniae]|uniref:spore coat protein U domain-containing protein n=1 Tax=Klebsiella pneumoniae TaxID=573 RepID=UPI003135F61E